MSDISDSLKHALDVSYSVAGKLGLHPYTVTKVDVYTTGSRPGVGTRNVVQTPITLKDGQNPLFTHVSSREVFLSNGQLTDKCFRLGPMVSAYSGSCGEGGLDSSDTQASSTASIQHALYFRVTGPGLAPSGSFFKVKWRKEDSSLSYVLYLEETSEKVQL